MNSKTVVLSDLIRRREQRRNRGERVVLTNGCFDILHRGHVEYLQNSATLGDALIVAVNSDSSVKQLKGDRRPINSQEDRAAVIASLECVDHVFIFEGPRLSQEILDLKPDVYTKAGDYTLDSLDPSEKSALMTVGAEIRFQKYIMGYSTTSIVGELDNSKIRSGSSPLSFSESVSQLKQLLDSCAVIRPSVEMALEILMTSLLQGNKVLACGNGGSAADAMHLCEELTGRYRLNRRSLPAVCLNSDGTALTCIANDFGFGQVFARQISALGTAGDVLVLFSTSGNSENILAAIEIAKEKGVKTILVGGRDGGKARGMCTVEIIVPSTDTARIQEVHTLILHTWLESIDSEYANHERR